MQDLPSHDPAPAATGGATPRHRADASAGALDPSLQEAGAAEVEVVRSEERLRVGTSRVPVERVRLVRDVVVEEVTRTVQVRREVLRIEREPLGPGAIDSTGAGVRGGGGATGSQVVEVVLREERPVVGVEVVPVERVRVEVVSVEEVVQVEDDVRVEQVDLEAPDRLVR